MTTQSPPLNSPAFALFNLGFRPFFFLASIYALISISVWGAIFARILPAPTLPLIPLHWHAHEMIFGYGMAVVAGFLLTAVRNWTQLPTLQNNSLAGICSLWLAARMAAWMIPGQIVPMMVLDLSFDTWLFAAILIPIIRARKHEQIGIASKVLLLLLSNLCFYLGVSGVLANGTMWGIFSGLYILLALVFTIARRVLPFFIERGVGYPITLQNWKWIDRSSLIVFLLFWISEVFWQNIPASATLAGLLFVIHTLRMTGWHTHGIWKRPLLWVLYVGYGVATLGFLLKALVPIFPGQLSTSALHAFALGGIGMISAGMMARISLGHTGRDIQQHSRLLAPIFSILLISCFTRVILPLIDPMRYQLWMGMALIAWIISFALFIWVYLPVLFKPRVDGKPG